MYALEKQYAHFLDYVLSLFLLTICLKCNCSKINTWRVGDGLPKSFLSLGSPSPPRICGGGDCS